MLRKLRSMSVQLAVAAIIAVSTGACGEDAALPTQDPRGATEEASFPVTIDTASGPVEITARPERVISLSPTATEMLFAIGAGDQVIAVDDQSDYPPEVPTTDLSGFEPNVEAIAKYEPDLVVAASGSGLKSLDDLKISLLVQPTAAALDDTYEQLEQLGAATGHVDEAGEQVETIRSRIEEIVASAPSFESAPTFYHELDDTYFTVTSDTFIGGIYRLAGLENIADEADKAGSGYPQLSAEYIIDANPDFIFLADSECCNQTPERVSQRPGWDQIAAVENGNVVDVGDDISSRWGPRVVDFLQIVVHALHDSELEGE